MTGRKAFRRACGLALALSIAGGGTAAMACGGGSDKSIKGYQAHASSVAGVNDTVTEVAAAVAAAVSATPGVTVNLSVTNVSIKHDSVSMHVDGCVSSVDGSWCGQRFIVLQIAPHLIQSDPKGLAVALAGVVGRILIEDISKQLAASGSPHMASVQQAAKKLQAMKKDDFKVGPS